MRQANYPKIDNLGNKLYSMYLVYLWGCRQENYEWTKYLTRACKFHQFIDKLAIKMQCNIEISF